MLLYNFLHRICVIIKTLSSYNSTSPKTTLRHILCKTSPLAMHFLLCDTEHRLHLYCLYRNWHSYFNVYELYEKAIKMFNVDCPVIQSITNLFNDGIMNKDLKIQVWYNNKLRGHERIESVYIIRGYGYKQRLLKSVTNSALCDINWSL